jgi:photolyase PhrII
MLPGSLDEHDRSPSLSRLRALVGDVLAERTIVHGEFDPQFRSLSRGAPVLVWTHHGLRLDEQPALAVAAAIARATDRPLLLYAGLAGPYPYCTARHLTFQLEGWRDLAADCAAAGVAFAPSFDLRSGTLASRAAEAACIVTEAWPLEPLRSWTSRLAVRSGRPVLAVDASCLVPMHRVPSSVVDRAFAFRDATASLRRRALAAPPIAVDWSSVRRPEGFDESDVARTLETLADIPRLVDELDRAHPGRIDRTVAPVLETPGGSSAGLRRWDDFRRARLPNYARDRNDAAIDGTSRMSPYLHWGMVAPFRIARDAAQDGAEKYLDELLVWRELAHAWCAARTDHDDVRSLPAWARRTLERHRGDRRERIDDDRLERGATGDRLWDLAQRSLVRHGELHNNVRMTWGKALLRWSADEHEALRRLLRLNHRYALDGSDPSSYGGLLWCLGLFDRPFEPARAIEGTLRPRPTAEHARRLDLDGYARIVERSASKGTVAVVGAGIAGLVCADLLVRHGMKVIVVDKGRAPGGRVCSRVRSDGRVVDHGAPGFVVDRDRDEPSFVEEVDRWIDAGCCAGWTARHVVVHESGVTCDGRAWHVGVPSMQAIARHLAARIEPCAEIRSGVEAARVAQSGARKIVLDREGRTIAEADRVVLAVPARQALALLDCATDDASATAMVPQWAAIFEGSIEGDRPWDAAVVSRRDEPMERIVFESSKPGRTHGADRGEAVVVHAGHRWSEEHLELDPIDVARSLHASLERVLGRSWALARPLDARDAHRWRFARAMSTTEPHSGDENVVVIGDWTAMDRAQGGGVAAAWRSGVVSAARLLARA